jgi:hypothetical protein
VQLVLRLRVHGPVIPLLCLHGVYRGSFILFEPIVFKMFSLMSLNFLIIRGSYCITNKMMGLLLMELKIFEGK